jgi:glutamate-1-semialdehyde aminotransferase
VTRSGSLLGLHFRTGPVRNFRDAVKSPADLGWLLYFELLEAGIHTAPGRSSFNLSTVMDEKMVEDAISRIGFALKAVAEAVQAG